MRWCHTPLFFAAGSNQCQAHRTRLRSASVCNGDFGRSRAWLEEGPFHYREKRKTRALQSLALSNSGSPSNHGSEQRPNTPKPGTIYRAPTVGRPLPITSIASLFSVRGPGERHEGWRNGNWCGAKGNMTRQPAATQNQSRLPVMTGCGGCDGGLGG